VNRVASLFAVVGLLLVLLGLLVSRLKSFGVTIQHGDTAFAFSPQFFLYGIAALFCAFASLDSAGYIPLSKALTQWHFWLSTISVILFIAGFSWLGFAAQRPEPPPNLSVGGTVIAILFVSSIPLFLIAQAWFAVGLLRTILHMRHT
jgi:hypothetical protein